MRLAAILRWDERGVEGSAKAHGICSNVAPRPVYRLLSRLPPDRRQDFLRSAGPQQLVDPLELPLGDDGGVCVLHTHRRRAVLGSGPPDQRARVGLVEQHVVDGGLEPLLSPGAGHALGVEGLGHVEGAFAL
jgi:hypothetical protein